MRIALLVEGQTERALLPVLRRYLQARLGGGMPRLSPRLFHGRIPTGQKLKRWVGLLLAEADAVVALPGAGDAKDRMREWVGKEPRFHPHAAQYEFEAWLLPYWSEIQRLSGSNRSGPSGNPEAVDHNRPPSRWIQEAFRSGSKGRSYVKPRDARRILDGQDLEVAAAACAELRLFLNTLLTLGTSGYRD